MAAVWGKRHVRANAVAAYPSAHARMRELMLPHVLGEWPKALRPNWHGEPNDIAVSVALPMSAVTKWWTGQVWTSDRGLSLRV
ncbi:SDR family oxidoreductase [Stenotrophomonas maltophilia]|nr:SDR family oxidoreductase [Stenotrophomonas maltophilia]EKT4080521.1 SDR family oxidoreductase [Stenotrophomonas maltophilia]